MISPTRHRALAALAVLTLLTFFPVLFADFIYWDDRSILTTNPTVLNFDVRRMFTDLGQGGYFPLTLLALSLENLVFGLNPTAFHAVGLLLHIGNCALVYLCLGRVLRLRAGHAWFAALLFAVHPLRVEPVAWVSGGMKDLLCTGFYLAALLIFDRGERSARRTDYLLGCALFLGALLAKAMAVTLPVAFLLMQRVRQGEWRRATVLRALPLFALSLAFGVLEMHAQRTGLMLSQLDHDWVDGAGNAMRALGFALARSLIPHALAIYYDPAVFRFDALDATALGLFTALVAALIWRRAPARLWWMLALFGAMLAPVVKFVPFGQDSLFNDRYLYLPALAFSAFLVEGVALLAREANSLVLRVVFAIALIGFAVHAHVQAWAWRTQETLWLQALERYPGTAKAYQNLSLFYLQNERYDRAVEVSEAALKTSPNDQATRMNLGVLYTRLGRLEDAEREFLRVLSVEPRNAAAYNNLAFAYARAGRKEEAAAAYRKALAIDPNFDNARQGLAELESR